jgi:curved DNA-binding protein CbpA
MKELLHYYSVLDVHPSAEFEVIESSYRRLAKKYHPDIYTGSKDEAERIMSDLNEAMRILSNKHLRHSYNAERPIKSSTFPFRSISSSYLNMQEKRVAYFVSCHLDVEPIANNHGRI